MVDIELVDMLDQRQWAENEERTLLRLLMRYSRRVDVSNPTLLRRIIITAARILSERFEHEVHAKDVLKKIQEWKNKYSSFRWNLARVPSFREGPVVAQAVGFPFAQFDLLFRIREMDTLDYRWIFYSLTPDEDGWRIPIAPIRGRGFGW